MEPCVCPTQDTSLYVPLAARSCKGTKLTSAATRPNKRVIQFDLDESCHVSTSVVEQSRDDYVISLLLVTRRYQEINLTQLLVTSEKIMRKINTKFDL